MSLGLYIFKKGIIYVFHQIKKIKKSFGNTQMTILKEALKVSEKSAI